ncbi:MAG: hypothetical protein QF596_08950 [Acidimicrobiales bacterium]|jgi:hypothetical protein|nr:hypothetical protein [Acidimicrobiales bacterium]MDP6298318.1 hypothetical protein [Acidimicrobiales bacterium]HJM28134.1 hypothetical protein [Acidimicrobiales bacterium]HJM98276.1 hypothetical protein [Acidimicrobiales bacterium]
MKTRYETIELTTHENETCVDLIKDHLYDPISIFWVNIEPDVDRESVHTGSIFWRAFSSRGPVIPKFTWVSATTSKSSYQHAQVGLTHPTGNAVLERLKDFHVEIPQGWILEQDHPKRGLVLQLPNQYDAQAVIDFALSSIPVLSPFEFDNRFLLKYPIQ